MLIEICAYILIAIGIFFIISSIIGLFRFPDFYTKLHAASVADSFGIPLCLLGLTLLQTSWLSTLKVIAIIILFFFLSPTGTHALIKAAFYRTSLGRSAAKIRGSRELKKITAITPETLEGLSPRERRD